MRLCPTIWRWGLLVRSLFRVVSASRWHTEPHIACCAAIPRREKHSCHHPTTVLSGSRSEWLSAVPCSENMPQGDAFRTMEDIESNATAEIRKIPKEASRQCIQQWKDRWSKCVCVGKGLTLKVIRQAFSYVLPLQCYTTIPGTLWLPLVFSCVVKETVIGCFQIFLLL